MLQGWAPDVGPEGGNGMMRARISTLALALAMGLGGATTVAAQVRTREKTDFAITGEITPQACPNVR